MNVSADAAPSPANPLFAARTSFSTLTPAAVDVHGTVSEPFIDRRSQSSDMGGHERRQFGNSHHDLSPDAKELATAIDRYKLEYRRRYITCEEMLAVVKSLGYHRD